MSSGSVSVVSPKQTTSQEEVLKIQRLTKSFDGISRQFLIGSTGMANLEFDVPNLAFSALILTALGTTVSWRFVSR
jgi:hypothetical protein